MFRAKSQSNKRPLRKSPFPTAASWQLIGSRWNRSTSSSSRPDACRTTWTITNDLMYEGAPIARYRICRTVFSSYLWPADLVVVDRDSFQLLDLPFWSPIKLFPFHFFFILHSYSFSSFLRRGFFFWNNWLDEVGPFFKTVEYFVKILLGMNCKL